MVGTDVAVTSAAVEKAGRAVATVVPDDEANPVARVATFQVVFDATDAVTRDWFVRSTAPLRSDSTVLPVTASVLPACCDSLPYRMTGAMVAAAPFSIVLP